MSTYTDTKKCTGDAKTSINYVESLEKAGAAKKLKYVAAGADNCYVTETDGAKSKTSQGLVCTDKTCKLTTYTDAKCETASSAAAVNLSLECTAGTQYSLSKGFAQATRAAVALGALCLAATQW